MLSSLSKSVAQYLVVTLSYWAFTLTDGALRMLVVLYFHGLGYSPMEVATLFLLYELFGVVTNLVGGWLAARVGLNVTMHIGLALQIVALLMLSVSSDLLGVAYVMLAQALSGIAKDLNKMSAKSSIKRLVPEHQQGRLYRWVALLTGSKNTLKGVGFFVGALLMSTVGFSVATFSMAAVLVVVLLWSLYCLDSGAGRVDYKPKFSQMFSPSQSVNHLSAARFFLFGARDVWFVVALPVFLQAQLGWTHTQVGILLAVWIIVYGVVQAKAPALTAKISFKKMISKKSNQQSQDKSPTGSTALEWALVLIALPLLIAFGCWMKWPAEWVIVAGLIAFAVVFAINSSVHSYLIVAYAKADGTSLDVGFYYMANAAGRLLGTLLSGAVYQFWGLEACLLVSSVMVALAALCSLLLPNVKAG